MYGRCSSSIGSFKRRLESLKLHRKRFADERRGFAVEDRRHKKYLPKDTAEVESATREVLTSSLRTFSLRRLSAGV